MQRSLRDVSKKPQVSSFHVRLAQVLRNIGFSFFVSSVSPSYFYHVSKFAQVISGLRDRQEIAIFPSSLCWGICKISNTFQKQNASKKTRFAHPKERERESSPAPAPVPGFLLLLLLLFLFLLLLLLLLLSCSCSCACSCSCSCSYSCSCSCSCCSCSCSCSSCSCSFCSSCSCSSSSSSFILLLLHPPPLCLSSSFSLRPNHNSLMKCAKKRGFATPFWLCCEIPFVGTLLTLSFKSPTRSDKFRDNTVRKRKEHMSKLFPAKFLENNCPQKTRVIVNVFSDLKSLPPKTFPAPVRNLFPGDLARIFYAKTQSWNCRATCQEGWGFTSHPKGIQMELRIHWKAEGNASQFTLVSGCNLLQMYG